MSYRHTQTAFVIIAGILGASLVGSAVLVGGRGMDAGLGGLILFGSALGLALFWSLTVEVEAGAVSCRFGIGLISKRIPLADIEGAEAVRNPWFVGWGIRWFPGRCWVWNASGFDAVELTLKGGKRFRIGTDEPAELVRAIEGALAVRR